MTIDWTDWCFILLSFS